MAENKVSVELTIEQAQALNALSNLGKGLDDFAKKADKAASNSSSSFSSFGKTVAAVFSGTVIAEFAISAVKSLASIPSVLSDIVEAGAEADAVNRRLAASLALAGAAGEESIKSFDELATTTSRLTGIDDDAIKSSASFALALGATDEQAKKIIKTAADLSVGLGVDFQTAVQQLSGTLEGSAGKLGKVSFAVRQLDEDALRSGKAIDIIAAKFKGLADVNAGNIGVQFANISVNLDNLEKSFGGAVTSSTAFRSLFLTINQGLESFTALIQKNGPAISEFTGIVVDGFVTATQATAAFVDVTTRAGAVIKNVFELGLGSVATAFNLVNASVLDAGNSIRGFLGIAQEQGAVSDAYGKLSESIQSVTQDSEDLTKALGPDAFAPGVQAVFDLGNAYEQNFQKITAADAAATATQGQLSQQRAAERAAEAQKKLDEEIAFQEQLNAIINQGVLARAEGDAILSQNNLILRTDEFANIQEIERQKLDLQFKAEEQKLALMQEGKKKEEAIALLSANKQKAITDLTVKQEIEAQQRKNKGIQDALSQISTLTQSSNKELFAIGKAAAISQATISGIQAVQNALAQVPYPFNFVAAALVGVASAANIGKIASQQPPAFENGGIVGGNSFSGDNVSAQVNSGEMILNRQQQANLFAQANGAGAGGGFVEAINNLGNRIAAMQIQLNVNGREIARIVRDEQQAGFAF